MDQQPANPQAATDHQLLRAYADADSQPAFAELVARHVDLIYSAARRQVGPDAAHLADDVTQAVFMILAQKARAAAIPENVVLAGWLYNTTRHVAANARRIEARRRRHERHGALMSHPTSDSTSRWDLAPLLDGALARLPSPERDALLLKYMQGKSHRAVGDALGISEDAARKRVARALHRLRALLVRHAGGATIAVPATAALATLLTTHAVHAAPPTLAAACALSGSTAVSASAAAALVKATASSLTWLKVKTIAASLALAATTLAGAIAYTAHHRHLQAAAAPPLAAQSIIPIAAPAPAPAEQPLRGIVLDADAHPLPGVEVYTGTPQRPIHLYDPAQSPTPVITAADGSFLIPRPPSRDWMLVAISNAGVAQVKPADLANPAKVILQPWGRVEGRLLAGDRPLPREQIYAGVWTAPDDAVARCVVSHPSARTDREGRFNFPRVAPGTIVLSHRDDRQETRFSKWESLDVQPAKVATVDLGATGRPVVGQLALPPGYEDKLTFTLDTVHWADITARRSDLVPMPVPAGFDKLPPVEQRKIRAAWNESPEGRQYRRDMYAEQYLPNPEGAFRLDALRPGRYQLQITLSERDHDAGTLENLASAYISVSIPPPPPGGAKFIANPPIDLGRIVLKPQPRIVIGQPAPPFQAFTPDGDPVRLTDFKGRLLALHVRWPRAADPETAGIGKAHSAFANDPRVAFLTLHLNTQPDELRRLITDEALEWPQALASRSGPFPLSDPYTHGPATILLIDPQGTARRKILKGNDLETAIAQLLLEREK